VLLVVLVVGGDQASGVTLVENLQYGFCEGAKQPMYLEYINIQPWPIPLNPNQELYILAHIFLYQNINAGSEVKLDITKLTGGVAVDVPCINTTFGPLGSCIYEGDVLTETLFHQLFCPDNQPEQPCSLPILPGHYGQQYDDPYYVRLPNITLQMDWFLSGTFDIKATVLDENGDKFTCLEFVVEVEEKNEPTVPPLTSPGPDTCPDCLGEINWILARLNQEDWLDRERKHLMLSACGDSPEPSECQKFLYDNWIAKISTCLYSDWMLDKLTCCWYGQCQGNRTEWRCEKVTEKLEITLASGDIVPGVRDHLIQHCCGSLITQPDCHHQVEAATPYILKGLSDWVGENTAEICYRDNSGSVTTTTSSMLSILIAVLCTLLR